MINNNVLCFRNGRKEHLLCFLPFHFSFAEIGWLAKASLIALETAVESLRGSVAVCQYWI